MKLKYCLTLTAILIILFSLASVSASENITDSSSVGDALAIQSPISVNSYESQNNGGYSGNNNVDLSISMNVKPSYEDDQYNPVGSLVPWTIKVNAKGGTSHNTRVLEVLSVNLGYVSHNTTIGTYDSESNTWQIGDLKNGETASLTILTKLKTAGTYTNKVYALSDSNDINQLNNFIILQMKTGSSKVTSNITETTDDKNGPRHNSHDRSMADYSSRIKYEEEDNPDPDIHPGHETNSNSVSKTTAGIFSQISSLSNIFNSNSTDNLSEGHVKAIQMYDYTKIPILIFILFLILLVSIVGYGKIKSRM